MMPFRVLPALLVLCSFAASASASASAQEGGYSKAKVDDPSVVAAAKFAVKAQRAKKEKVSLDGITAAATQVVAGTNYKLTMQIVDRGSETPLVGEVVAVVYEDLDGNRKLTSWTWGKRIAKKR